MATVANSFVVVRRIQYWFGPKLAIRALVHRPLNHLRGGGDCDDHAISFDTRFPWTSVSR